MQKILIAGGTSGIGLSTAKLLISKGYQVTIFGRNPEKLESALADIRQSSEFSHAKANDTVKINGAKVDGNNASELKNFFSEVGEFDHLVITIGGGKGMGAFRELDLKTLKEGFEEKFFPQLQTAQEALPHLTSHGSITFLTAVSSQSKLPGTSGLAAINGALELMIPTLAKELKPLRINAVSPGVINNSWWNFLPEAQKKKAFEQYAQISPVGRVGESEDVATMVAALIENSFITGQTVVVDGGLSLGQ